MQVKKFEAKTMKEALELVKRHLGPEAIILSAKDNSRGFGLVGQRSVEVTAAISDETLRRKQLAESKMSLALKEKYEHVPAWRQRDFIAKANRPPAPVPRPAKGVRYADILDEEAIRTYAPPAPQIMPQAAPKNAEPASPARERVRTAAQRAWQAMTEAEHTPAPPVAARSSDGEIQTLKDEILRLKSTIESFQKVPQTFINMHPGAEFGIHYDLSSTYQKLLRAGLSVDITVEIIKLAQSSLSAEQLKKTAFVDAWIAKYIMERTQIADQRTAARVHCFIGPAGQGKTSVLVKLAGHMVICEKKRIAIVTADTAKVGASEQLRIYAQILNVPFAIVRSSEDWRELILKLGQVEHILVDYPGLNLKSMHEIDQLRTLLPASDAQAAIHYVQSVLANDESAFEAASRYQMIGFQDVIFTGLDEAAQHGLIFNFQHRFQVPLHSFGIGRQIPEDFEPATRERVVDLIFKLSKMRKDKVP